MEDKNILMNKLAQDAIMYGYAYEMEEMDKEAGIFDSVGKLVPKLKSFGETAALKGMYAKDAIKGYAGKAGVKFNTFLNNRSAIRGGAKGMSPGAKAWAGLDNPMKTPQLLKEELGLLKNNKTLQYGVGAAGGVIGLAGLTKILGRLGKAGTNMIGAAPATGTALTATAKNKLLGIGAAAAGAGGAYALMRNRGDRR